MSAIHCLSPRLLGSAGLLTLGVLLSAGCGEDRSDDPVSKVQKAETGMLLSAQVDDSKVAGMRFEIDRVGCTPGEDFDPLSQTHEGDLEDLTLPSFIEESGGSVAEGSEHDFADYYTVLPAGCYDVVLTPLDENGNPVEDCSSPSAEAVVVQDGKTTEILLFTQCDGAGRGGLDTIAGINHPPEVDQLVYAPSKFVGVCQNVVICATATDPDNDPLEFVWRKLDGPDGGEVIAITSPAAGESCLEVEASEEGTYEYEVTVYDLLQDENGDGMRFEDYIGIHGDEVVSHDTLSFPVHAVASGDFECETDDGENCVDLTDAQVRQQVSCDAQGGTVTFTIPEGVCDEKLSFTSYELPDGTILPFEDQVVFDNVTDFYGPGTHTVTVDLPPACGYQTDLYLGEVLTTLNPSNGHGSSLLCYDVQEDPQCT